MPTLLIIRGAPGAGKSKLAAALVAQRLFDYFIEADNYFLDRGGVYKFDHTKLEEAHEYCFNRAKEKMDLGHNVIISNTNREQWEFEKYVDYAKNLGYTIQVMILDSDFENIHGVSKGRKERMWFDLLLDVTSSGHFGIRHEHL